MPPITLSCSKMEKILQFLADEQNKKFSDFIEEIDARMRQKEERLNFLATEMAALSAIDREKVLEKARDSRLELNSDMRKQIEADQASVIPQAHQAAAGAASLPTQEASANLSPKIRPLSSFLDMPVSELTHSKPELLIINGESIKISSWKELILAFVRYLVSKKEITSDMLPLCPNPRSRKALINSIPAQPPGSGKSGLFEKLSDKFYVDIKYNAKYHLLNIWQTLDFLDLRPKYDVRIALR